MTHILGISAFYHDSAAALVSNSRIVAAAQEERFTRKKHDSGYPTQAIEYCLREGGIAPAELTHVVFYDKPFLKFERLLETYLTRAPRGFQSFRMAMPVWLREKLFQKDLLAKQLKKLDKNVDWASRLLFTEHHQSHAASAFYPSPFGEAAVLTMDGVGEWATTSLAVGRGNQLAMLRELHFPHSLGLLYSAFTYYCGFKVNSGEYKLMGLAPYGEPKYAELILDKLLDLKEDGSFKLHMEYFNYATGLTMTGAKFHALFGAPPRAPEEKLTQNHMDIAASIQHVLEEVVLRMARYAKKETGLDNLCLAGGVALNCVANGKLLREGIFKNIWIQPAAGDAGGALGAALAAHYYFLGGTRNVEATDNMRGAYLGPAFTTAECEAALRSSGAIFETLSDSDITTRTAAALASGNTVGWMQGRMEFGPRALGGRSILADPRNPEMQRKLNLQVKFRESFRPFAPSVLEGHQAEWFGLDQTSPYMLLVADVAEKHRLPDTASSHLFGIEKLNVPRSSIPAVTHVDYSARVQTVHAETNPRYHALISEFNRLTGCPVLVNTSFNVRGEPIVCTPEDAFRCFMGCDIDILVVGNCWLEKAKQDTKLKHNYAADFELD